jgi:hypothetical protein
MKKHGLQSNPSNLSDEIKTDSTTNEFEVPTLDQFMELVTDEKKSVVSSPSGYRVYNKYHKTS